MQGNIQNTFIFDFGDKKAQSLAKTSMISKTHLDLSAKCVLLNQVKYYSLTIV